MEEITDIKVTRLVAAVGAFLDAPTKESVPALAYLIEAFDDLQAVVPE
jgi:hypothetical protein